MVRPYHTHTHIYIYIYIYIYVSFLFPISQYTPHTHAQMFGFNNELQLPPGAPPIVEDSEDSSDDESAVRVCVCACVFVCVLACVCVCVCVCMRTSVRAPEPLAFYADAPGPHAAYQRTASHADPLSPSARV
jgi:hypothetical protein